jgi:uncharacterized membrane protein YkoI
MRNFIISIVVIGVLVFGIFGCNSARKVKLSQVSAPARATIEKLTAGGEIKVIEKETSNGKTIYDVEAKVKDKDVEYDIAENGEVITSEESVPYASIPSAVKQAAEKYFGSTEGLSASKEIEENKTYYEVEGKKSGKVNALKLDDKGKIIEEEKEE